MCCNFEGRAATTDDLADGLTVPLFFPASSALVSDGLMSVLGAGWDHYWVPEIPCRVPINVAFTVESLLQSRIQRRLCGRILLRHKAVPGYFCEQPGGRASPLTSDSSGEFPEGKLNAC